MDSQTAGNMIQQCLITLNGNATDRAALDAAQKLSEHFEVNNALTVSE
jgi:hypothetical protein